MVDAAATRSARSGSGKRRIPLGLLPYSSSESEGEEEPEPAASAIGARLRHRAAECAGENRGAAAAAAAETPEKRRKRESEAGAAKSSASPARVSGRARQSPMREGFVDITQPGLSFAHSKGVGSAQVKIVPEAVGPPGGAARSSGGRQPHPNPSASAATANGQEVSRALSELCEAAERGTPRGASFSSSAPAAAARAGPQTPAGAPASRTVRPGHACIAQPSDSNANVAIADLFRSASANTQMAMTDSRVPAPGRGSSTAGPDSARASQRRASSNSAERRPRGSVTFAPDVVSPPASRVRLHKEARRHSEELLSDDEAADLTDRFGGRSTSNAAVAPVISRCIFDRLLVIV